MKLVQRMINAHISDDIQKFQELRGVYEGRYLYGHQKVVYRLVVNFFDPIERWRDGSIRSNFVIGEFIVTRDNK